VGALAAAGACGADGVPLWEAGRTDAGGRAKPDGCWRAEPTAFDDEAAVADPPAVAATEVRAVACVDVLGATDW
jgi:hypothetical protein